MNPLSKIAQQFSANARKKRASLFRHWFDLNSETKILDLGSEIGSNISNVLKGTPVLPQNIFIADIDQNAILEGEKLFGFTPVLINEGQPLNYEEGYFDIVYCSSVIEHTTLPKSEIWKVTSNAAFKSRSWIRQVEFAAEIKRLGKQFFVQTPNANFPIESHTWLPFMGYLPRPAFLKILKLTNQLWVKKAEPDFNLLNEEDMEKLFPEARIEKEIKWGLVKSIMAIRSFKKQK